jgi:hypothetical protein
MLLLTATTDKLQLITAAAGTLDVHASFIDMSKADPPVVKGSTSDRQHTAITTATTTDIVAAPAASTTRNVKTLHIRNKSASTATDVTILFNQNATTFELWKASLGPGEALEYVEGIGFFEVNAAFTSGVVTNRSTAAQGAGFAADTYLIGSSVPLATPVVGATYILMFDMTKTAAGIAAGVLTVRIGTAGSTADTARCTFTFSAGTAATDTGVFTVMCTFRTVGAGTSAVLQGRAQLDSQPTTGLSSLIHAAVSTSGGFDSTVANSIIGASFNGGTSFSGTVQLVTAEMKMY